MTKLCSHPRLWALCWAGSPGSQEGNLASGAAEEVCPGWELTKGLVLLNMPPPHLWETQTLLGAPPPPRTSRLNSGTARSHVEKDEVIMPQFRDG